MNFSDLYLEVFSHGFDYLNDAGTGGTGLAKVKRWVNAAYLEVCDAELWPFLQATASGAAPLTVADLRAVETVVDTATMKELHPLDIRTLTTSYRDLSTPGSPQWYYVYQGSVIKTYPVGGTLNVVYWRVPAELSADGDVPVVPGRFHDLIVDCAVRRAYIDAADYWMGQIIQGEVQTRMQAMRDALLTTQYQENDRVQDVSGDLDFWY